MHGSVEDPIHGSEVDPMYGYRTNLGEEEEEVCAFGWLKLCSLEADGRFVMRAHEGLSLRASQGDDSD